ncbi:MAG: bifunctional DNA primase/polymerase [Actinocrinis sp.]
MAGRTAALRYASWGWPVTPDVDVPATTDLEQVFAAWTRVPDAPILAACGVAFDVIGADAAAGRTALLRLDRLGVELGPVTVGPGIVGQRGPRSEHGHGYGHGHGHGASQAARLSPSNARIGFLVRAGTADALSPLIDADTRSVLSGRGAYFELPRMAADRSAAAQPFRPIPIGGRVWLRSPSTSRPVLPAAHVVLGALALVPYRERALAAASRGR